MKINNKAYNTRKYAQLFANYIWHETKNIDLVTKILLKHSKQKIFNIITNSLSFLVPVYEKEYNLDISTSEKYRILIFEKEPRLCKHCSNRVMMLNNTFCSVTCTNQYKATDEKYLTKLSSGLKEYYKTADKETLNQRHYKIKNTVNDFNSKLSPEQKSIKYTNKTLIYDAYKNRKDYYSHLTFLFDKDFYYNNRYLPVSCNKCGFKWEMTKSTNISRTICTVCNPQEKAKTQRKLFEYIYGLTYCKNNDRSLIKDVEIDILVESHKFGIEYDGLLPHSFGDSKISFYNKRNINTKYHLRKTELIEEKGYHLFHISENEWSNVKKQKIWISMIHNKLNLCNKIFARKCYIKELLNEECSHFLEENHLQGRCESDIRLGLFYDDKLVSVMTFKKHKHYDWEMTRFANKLHYSVIGGASKLLNYFERTQHPKMLLSYANRRWSKGGLYDKLKFNFEGNTMPNYFYFKINENIMYPSEKFQKNKLKNVLNIYDENESETTNMFNNEYRVIYDCGSKKYVKYYN